LAYQFAAGEFANHKALGRLRLNALCYVNHQHHEVNDLGAACECQGEKDHRRNQDADAPPEGQEGVFLKGVSRV
jgi:hypothetical protein